MTVGAAASSARALVIEHDDALCAGLRAMLGQVGFCVTIAADPADAPRAATDRALALRACLTAAIRRRD